MALSRLSVGSMMLKSFQKVANRVFQAFYDAPPCVQGFVGGRSVVGNAGIHVGMNYVFNSDLKDFFPSMRPSSG